MPCYQLHKEQLLPASIEEVWDFVSRPKNLRIITPDYMGFDIVSTNDDQNMYPGMIIIYKVSPFLGIKLTWVTEITHVTEGKFFVDEQRLGPYSMWHHEHHLSIHDEGTLMTDIVTYRPPFGFAGSLVNRVLIKNKLDEIFKYRRSAMSNKFPGLQ